MYIYTISTYLEGLKMKVIMKKSLALHLMKCGHDLVDCKKSTKRIGFNVYIFQETPELIADMLVFNTK